MKKNSTCSQSSKGRGSWRQGSVTIGMDLGDKNSRYCVLNENGEIVKEGRLATSKKGLAQEFGALRPCRIALEVGTHSPWVSRYLRQLGHETIVANARQVQLVSQSSRKDDRLDAAGAAGASGRSVIAAHPAPQRISPDAFDASGEVYEPLHQAQARRPWRAAG